jgi:4-amino-4-deoxy-L-arabinose transferase-like glycosyltransferase
MSLRLFLLIAAGALSGRLAWIFLLLPPALYDAQEYLRLARGIAAGLGYVGASGEPTAFMPVGWPALGALGLLAFGDSATALALVNLLAQAGAVGATIWLGRALELPRSRALAAAAVVALAPNLFPYTVLLWSESTHLLFATLAIAAAATAWRAPGERALPGAIVAGLAAGGAALIKTQSLLLVPALLLPLLLSAPSWARRLGLAAVLAAMAVGVMLPWSLRNLDQGGRWPVLATNAGWNLLIGFNPEAKGRYAELDTSALDAALPPSPPGVASEIARGDAYARAALDDLRAEPMRALRLVPIKTLITLADGDGFLMAGLTLDPSKPSLKDFTARPTIWRQLFLVSNLWWLALVLAAAVGAARARQRGAVSFLAVAGAALLLPHMIVFGEPRFHIPLIPLLAVAACLPRATRPAP